MDRAPLATTQTFACSDFIIMTEAEAEELPDYALACDDAFYDSVNNVVDPI